ncbi:MAG TPA: glycine oxidase ThiO [Gammaproteobacteria bacterium]|nr:glycine oxidase ThiO [Gammaproteobacteria bacterium]
MTEVAKARCVVVGGGLIGMLTARELRAAGVDVRIMDRQAAGQEASWAGGGILSPLYPWRFPDPVTDLASWGQEYYPTLSDELAAETGIDPEWTQSGLLILDAEERDSARAWAQRHGLRLELLDRAEIRRCESAVMDPEGAAIWLPDVAQIRNPRFLKCLRRSLELRGVPVEEHAEVRAVAVEHGRVVGVDTREGRVPADRVVVAGGAWTGQLLASMGLELPVHPVRGQMILFHTRPGLLHRIVLYQDHYLIPRRDGRILAGSTLEHTGYDKSTTEGARKLLYTRAVQLLPDLADYGVERHWAGLRPGSPTGVPFIGEHPTIQGLFVNAGHFRNGVVLGPASARLLRDLFIGHTPIIDATAYSLS